MARNPMLVKLRDDAYSKLEEISVGGARCSLESLVIQAVDEFIIRWDGPISKPQKPEQPKVSLSIDGIFDLDSTAAMGFICTFLSQVTNSKKEVK